MKLGPHAVAALFLIGACGGSPEAPTASQPTSVGPDDSAPTSTPDESRSASTDDESPDPVLELSQGPNGEEALVGGVLVLDDGCLFVDSGAARRSVVVWGSGTSWDATARSVITHAGTRLPLGQPVVGNGGFSDPAGARSWIEPPEVRDRAVQCAASTGASIVYVGTLEPREPTDADRAVMEREAVAASLDINTPLARLITSTGVRYSCGGSTHTLTEAPDSLADFPPLDPAFAAPIERLVSGRDTIADEVTEWAALERRQSDAVDVLGLIPAPSPDERHRYVSVELEPSADGQYRYVDWNECRLSPRLDRFATVRVRDIRAGDDTRVAVATVITPNCGPEADVVAPVALIEETDRGPSLALFAIPAGATETGRVPVGDRSCVGSPPTEVAVVLPPGVAAADLLDGTIAPPAPFDGLPPLQPGGRSAYFANPDEAVTAAASAVTRATDAAGADFISHVEIILDVPGASAGVLVVHLPETRAQVEEIVDTARTEAGIEGVADVPIVLEEQDWTRAQADELASSLQVVLRDAGFASAIVVRRGDDSLVVIADLPTAFDRQRLEEVLQPELDGLGESRPSLSSVPVFIS